MFARAKSISHGLDNLRYITGESSNKKKPEKISHVCDHLFENLDAEGMWRSMQLDLHKYRSWKGIKNGVIRIEISPIMENTAGYTRQDWIDLWTDFLREFDDIQLINEQGKLYSDRTNLAGSKYTVWFHEESKSGIPHLHADVCRVDHDGRINNDHDIHIRAQKAATKVALKRGWETTQERHETNVEKVARDCMAVLKSMSKWNLQTYFSLLRAKGYEVIVHTDEDGVDHGYSMKIGNSNYKSSIVGTDRMFTIKNLESSWKKLHSGQMKVENPKAVQQPKPKKKKPNQQTSPKAPQTAPVVKPYLEYQDGFKPFDVKSGGRTIRHYLPERVTDFLNDEFDYRELSNSEQLQNLCAALFLGYVDALAAPGSGGGGGTSSDLKWGRDPKEDEMEYLKRCARKAKSLVSAVKRTGVKR